MTETLTRTLPDFIKWLEEKKSAHNLKTDSQLAEMLNIRRATMSMILTSRRGPSAALIQTIIESQNIIYGTPEYVRLLTAAHITNLDQEKRRRRVTD